LDGSRGFHGWKLATVGGLLGALALSLVACGSGSGSSLGDLRWDDDNPAWSPNGREIVFSSNRGDPESNLSAVYMMRSDGSAVRRLTSGSVDAEYPSFSPDGKEIVYIANLVDGQLAYTNHGEIDVVRTDGTGQRVIARSDPDPAPAWSPDGRWIAFIANRGLYLDAPDGSRLHLIAAGARSFAWSPDGKRVAYGVVGEGLYTVQIDSGKRLRLERWHANVAPPWPPESGISWSPDGSQIAFVRGPLTDDGQALLSARVLVVRSSGAGEREIRDVTKCRPSDVGGVVWLPRTASSLLVDCLRGIYLAPVKGRRWRLVSDNRDRFEESPAPAPRGRNVLVVEGRGGSDYKLPESAIFLINIRRSSNNRLTQNGLRLPG
jgi:Tol biopolymer transport system component